MIILKHPAALLHYLDSHLANNNSIGFVPTMGALHPGHISLLKQSKKETDLTVCSIFINPTQFNDIKDYEKYPVDIEADIYKIESVETDILFLPERSELYPHGTDLLEQYDLGYLETVLEGKFRPGHFQGVLQVMSRLLTTVKPAKLFMGQKDYQQALVIQHLLKTMHADIQLVICPTIRESDGLAMSSRNVRLRDKARGQAAVIHRTLNYIKNNFSTGDLRTIKTEARSLLAQNAFIIDYVEIADADTLQLVNDWNGKQTLIALIAGFIDNVRLIDNMILNQDDLSVQNADPGDDYGS